LPATTSTASATLPPASLPSTATTPSTITPTTSIGPTTSTPPTTTAPSTTVSCPVETDVSRRESPDPLAMSSLYGADIRTGQHPCVERIVIELQGDGGFPGWWVEYQDDPITLGESEETAFILGDATLTVRLGVWMQTTEYLGYDGPWDLFPTNVEHIRELRLVENWEGITIWAIGLDRPRGFVVHELASPPRLVIDVDTSAGA
jgi:hypothetical protein